MAEVGRCTHLMRSIPVFGFCFERAVPLSVCVLDEVSQNTLLCDIIWLADHSVVLLKQKQAGSCYEVLQAATELNDDEMTWLHFHAKTAIKSPNTILILFDPRLKCQAIQNTCKFYVYMTNNMEIVPWIHSIKNTSASSVTQAKSCWRSY